MSRRPLPIQPASEREIAAGWANIKARVEAPRPQWRLAWIVASVIAFLSVSAGASVVFYRTVIAPRRVAPEAPMSKPTTTPTTTQQAQQPPALEPSRDEVPAEAPVVEKPRLRTPRVEKRNVHTTADSAPIEEKPPEEKVVEQPADVFVLGSQARARGDFNKALGYYEKFVADHPADSRAALAAIEACRILADNLEEPRKALVWAERTIALSPRGPIGEDARARQVQLLGVTGATDRCVDAKAKFTRDYPQSIHTERVNRACH